MYFCQVLLCLTFITFVKSLRLCDSILDYSLPFSSNCYDSDIDQKNVSQIITDWGFQSEEYHLQTEDGYNLLINRGYKPNEGNETRRVVILSHGMYLNGLTFVARGNESLGYSFISEGYDVWIPNYRGTRYSRSHISLSPDELAFWDFSYQEIAIYDVRQTVEFINSKTNQKALYIGYSAGSTFGVIYTSLYPEDAQKNLLGTYYYSTAVYWNNSPSIYQLVKYFVPILNPIFNGFLHGEFIPNIGTIARLLCTGTTLNIYVCEIAKSLVAGFDFQGMDPVGTVLLNGVLLDSTSWKTLEHFLQNMLYKDFSMFNYGKEKNLQIYGQESPPSYNMSNIAVPVGLVLAQNDFLSATKDVDRFYNELSSDLRRGYTVINYSKFMHLDYIQVKDINERFTIPLLSGVANLISEAEN